MFYKLFYILFMWFIIFKTGSFEKETDSKAQVDSQYDTQNRFNVVLFLANTEINSSSTGDALAQLNFSQITKVKPCTQRRESLIPPDFSSMVRGTRSTSCDCNKIVNVGISTLVKWAKRVAGMVTAVITITSYAGFGDTKSDFAYYSFNVDIDSSLKSAKDEHDDIRNRYQIEKHQNEEGGLPPLIKTPDGVINAFPPESKYQFNDVNKFHRGIAPEDYSNVLRVKRKLKIEPESSEVHEVDGVPSEATREMVAIPLLSKQTDSAWDMLGLVHAIRNSFFSPYLSTFQDPMERVIDEEKGLKVNMLGTIRKPSIFQAVKTAMHQILQRNGRAGFLFIVSGGNFSELSEPQSELYQSIKFVGEITCTDNTLFVVGGSCLRTSGIVDLGLPGECKNALPIYGKGLGAELLESAEELYDIPMIIKDIIFGVQNIRSGGRGEFHHESNHNTDEEQSPSDRGTVEKKFDIFQNKIALIKRKRDLARNHVFSRNIESGFRNVRERNVSIFLALLLTMLYIS